MSSTPNMPDPWSNGQNLGGQDVERRDGSFQGWDGQTSNSGWQPQVENLHQQPQGWNGSAWNGSESYGSDANGSPWSGSSWNGPEGNQQPWPNQQPGSAPGASQSWAGAQPMVPQSGYYSGNPAGAMIPVQYGSAYAPGPFAVGPYGANPYGTEPFTGLPYSDKSKTAAGLLQIFLGGLGVGRFYMGDVGIGVAQLLVTVFTLGFGALWGFIDGIIILAGRPLDNEGRPLHP